VYIANKIKALLTIKQNAGQGFISNADEHEN